MTRAQLALGSAGGVLLLGIGAATGVLWSTSTTPEVLASASPVTSVPVTSQTFDDARTVDLTVTVGPAAVLTSPVGGRITEFGCADGTAWESGTSTVAVDGVRLLNLATASPLWRDLVVGDRGEDVRLLQEELVRWGHDVRTDGTLDRATWSALDSTVRQTGAAALPARTIPIARLLWLPHASVEVAGCTSRVGAVIEEGTELADLTVDLTSVALTRVPEGSLAGARTLTVEGVTVELDGDNRVTDPTALDALSQLASLRASTEQEGMAVTGTWSLRDPLEVAVIPPHALSVEQSGACVVTSDEAQAVTVVGSELGQSFVTFDGEVPDQVDAHIGDVQCP